MTEFGQLNVIHNRSNGRALTLFLHGLGGTWSSWTPLLQAAESDGVDMGYVALVDLLGFGRSVNVLRSLDSKRVGQALLDVALEMGSDAVRLTG